MTSTSYHAQPYVIAYKRMPSNFNDGSTYDRISAPLERIGVEVLQRLELSGEETVLDAGCGSGRVTQALLARLPGGHVIGVDGSEQMIAAARARLGPAAELIVEDLEQLDIHPRRVDAILSTATFHWIEDHARLFGRLRAALRAGGALVAQCGGEGNTKELLAACRAASASQPFAPYLDGWAGPWHFVGAEETTHRLHAAGFEHVRTEIVSKPPPFEELLPWLRANALTAHFARLPEQLRESYVHAVADELGPRPHISYVRLNIDAVAA
ncbi:MAG: class I SAM-dependent methyltransferase [Solirubrobacteraceae bacterium]